MTGAAYVYYSGNNNNTENINILFKDRDGERKRDSGKHCNDDISTRATVPLNGLNGFKTVSNVIASVMCCCPRS